MQGVLLVMKKEGSSLFLTDKEGAQQATSLEGQASFYWW